MKEIQYVKLGSSDLSVSEVCLGTMTWGQQNTEPEAKQQMDYAFDQGINFIDTAELYAVPPKPETQGMTEQYIGNWFAENPGRRDDIVLATKISGGGVSWVRGGEKISAQGIKLAVEDSLRRLQTDHIDLYQLHWPSRESPHFAKHWPGMPSPEAVDVSRTRAEFLEILQGLNDCVVAGKIRYCGLSNDTPWGLKEYLELARQHVLPSMVSMQNEFSLLHVKDSPYFLETCVLDDVAYLPWSPLAGGALSGKYRNGAKPENCRWTMVQRKGIFRDTTHTHEAIDAYYEVAQKHGLSLAQMSLAWVFHQKSVTSTIIGATSMEHLIENIGAYSISLGAEVLADIDQVLRRYPSPF